MEPGQVCHLRFTDSRASTATAASSSSPPSPTKASGPETAPGEDDFTVTVVIVAVRPHAEDPTRLFYYVHCTHIDLSAEVTRQRRRASAPSWNGVALGGIGSGTLHRCNELRVAANDYVSADGYHYRFDGWYEASALHPVEEAGPESFSSRPSQQQQRREESKDDLLGRSTSEETTNAGALTSSSVALQRRPVPEEWIAAMERDTAVCEVVFLCYAFQPWFPAPYTALQYLALPDEDVCHSVYLCHRCLSPFFTREQYFVHLEGSYCLLRCPPGQLIYHDQDTGYKAYLIDGAKHLHYCRCLSLLGKHFIESKLLINDVDLYEYVVVTMPRASLPFCKGVTTENGDDQPSENAPGTATVPSAASSSSSSSPKGGNNNLDCCAPDSSASISAEAFRAAASSFDCDDWDGDVVMGYFSRLKHHPNHTLSCIVTLPIFQRTRVATFLLDLAYWMTRQRQRRCGAAGCCGTSGGAISRPFSPQGQSLLLSYWRRALLRALAHAAPPQRRTSRATTTPSLLAFTLAELRAMLEIPVHVQDLELLLLQSEFTFYTAATATTSAGNNPAEFGSGSGGTLPSPLSAKKTKRNDPASAASADSRRKTSTSGTASASGATTTVSVAGQRYTTVMVLENAVLDAALDRPSKTARRTYVIFEKRWLVKDSRGVYAYDFPQFHY